ncbi:MAG TPA: hypothetical protein VHF25_11575 [Nitriliruptorales bacterium]|nr:hypothetical protein [Nitriliruptorales bacterium]
MDTSVLPAYLALLRDRNYRLFFVSTAASSSGIGVGVLAILALTGPVVGAATSATAFSSPGS